MRVYAAVQRRVPSGLPARRHDSALTALGPALDPALVTLDRFQVRAIDGFDVVWAEENEQEPAPPVVHEDPLAPSLQAPETSAPATGEPATGEPAPSATLTETFTVQSSVVPLRRVVPPTATRPRVAGTDDEVVDDVELVDDEVVDDDEDEVVDDVEGAATRSLHPAAVVGFVWPSAKVTPDLGIDSR